MTCSLLIVWLCAFKQNVSTAWYSVKNCPRVSTKSADCLFKMLTGAERWSFYRAYLVLRMRLDNNWLNSNTLNLGLVFRKSVIRNTNVVVISTERYFLTRSTWKFVRKFNLLDRTICKPEIMCVFFRSFNWFFEILFSKKYPLRPFHLLGSLSSGQIKFRPGGRHTKISDSDVVNLWGAFHSIATQPFFRAKPSNLKSDCQNGISFQLRT